MSRKLLVLALAVGTALGQPAEGEQADYAWFKSLGYPDLGKLPFVRIDTGAWRQTGSDPPVPLPDYGVLIEDRGKEFTVFTLGLATDTYQKTKPKTAKHNRVGYERIDVTKSGLGSRHAVRCRQFVLAYSLAARGHAAKASKLWKAAARDPSLEAKLRAMDGDTTSAIRVAVGGEARRNIRTGFEDHPQKTFTQHLATHRWWRKHFAEGVVDEDERILERMAAAEQARKRSPPKARHAMTAKERIGEDVYKLRYTYDVEAYREDADSSPVGIVAKHGIAAVPALLEAAGSERFTRSLRRQRVFMRPTRGWVTNYRVGDIALIALGRIAGRNFGRRRDRFFGKSAGGVEAAKAWWTEVQAKGEFQVLAAGVRKADNEAPAQADILARKYAAKAADVLLAALPEAEQRVRNALIRTLAGLEDERVGPALKKDAKAGNVTAAWELLRRGKAEAVRAMIAAWKAGGASDALLRFLCYCGSSAVVDTIRQDLPKRPVRVRMSLVSQLLHGRESALAWEPSMPKCRSPDCTWSETVEALLAMLLEDTAKQGGMFWMSGRFSFQNPRVCDVAAAALATRYPKKYRFDHKAGQAARDTQRIVMLNKWRAEQGLGPLTVPQRVAGPRAGQVVKVEIHPKSAKPDEAFQKLLDALVGKPLTGDAFIGIVLHVTRSLPAGSKGIRLRATRDDQGAYRITLRLLKKPYKQGYSRDPSWNKTHRLFVDGETWIGFNQGSLSLGYAKQDKPWAEYLEKLDKAFATDPRKTLDTWILLGLDR